jgi:hypothetical protein
MLYQEKSGNPALQMRDLCSKKRGDGPLYQACLIIHFFRTIRYLSSKMVENVQQSLMKDLKLFFNQVKLL